MKCKPASALIAMVSVLFMSCASIPDHVLKQEEHRQQLLDSCASALHLIGHAQIPANVSLAECDSHQDLAVSMLEDFTSRSKLDRLNDMEWYLAKDILDDVELIDVKVCFADVKRGNHVTDDQGRSGIAVCDKKLQERRHEQTRKAIQRAQDEAFIYMMIMRNR